MAALVYLLIFAVFILLFLVAPLAILAISLGVGGATFVKKRRLGLAIIFLVPSAPMGCLCGVVSLFFYTPSELARAFPVPDGVFFFGGPLLGIVMGIFLTVVSWLVLNHFEKSKTGEPENERL